MYALCLTRSCYMCYFLMDDVQLCCITSDENMLVFCFYYDCLKIVFVVFGIRYICYIFW